MSRKRVYESSAKEILELNTKNCNFIKITERVVIDETTKICELPQFHPWLLLTNLVVKPDQLIKRRGKLGLIGLNLPWNCVYDWINSNMKKTITIDGISGILERFIIEPYIAHHQHEEHYFCIMSQRDMDVILYNTEGGINVDCNSPKTIRIPLPVDDDDVNIIIRNEFHKNADRFESTSSRLGDDKQFTDHLIEFATRLLSIYRVCHMTYFELNPVVISESNYAFHIIDVAMQLDSAASYLNTHPGHWPNDLQFPPEFGSTSTPEERYIEQLDSRSGASLKLKVLNRHGRIWTMIAGGGASVIYSDTVCDFGGSSELANYGEYSGAPTETQTFEYSKTILKLMTGGDPLTHYSDVSSQSFDSSGKVLIIGGGIANFTNVAVTFAGIIRALELFKFSLAANKVSIYVRRGGPNYQEGLQQMRNLGKRIGIPIHVFGPETHMTAIVGMALGNYNISPESTPDIKLTSLHETAQSLRRTDLPKSSHKRPICLTEFSETNGTFTKGDLMPVKAKLVKEFHFQFDTLSIVWGLQEVAIQGMLDFDYLCRKSKPSVSAIVYPFSGERMAKFYFGNREILIPVYTDIAIAFSRHPEAVVLINFASHRSVYSVCMEVLHFKHIKCIAIIAEGVPERLTQLINVKARHCGVLIIGPATVGAIKPGYFKIGNTGGMLDNIISCKLYRPGSVAYVSRSGGMSNELNNIIARNSDGVYEGVAIGGDKFPGSTFMDHLMRYEKDQNAKILMLLGEIGGRDEYDIVEALRSKVIKKPLIAWCIGTCSSHFSSSIQFGHANACASSESETSIAKNKALAEAGALVPSSFDDIGNLLKTVFDEMTEKGQIHKIDEVDPPTLPMDYKWAVELGLIRKPSSFVSTISDERGKDLLYFGMPVTSIIDQNMGIGGTIGLLWFRKRLPQYFCRYLEMILILTADHGPAVCGAHNTMVTARANRDLVSSLCSGLLTIGDRFGGAVNNAAKMFSQAFYSGQSPEEFVTECRKKGVYIQGIGHRVKSVTNPDSRVKLLIDYVRKHIEKTELLDYALKVEAITTAKKPNLILNVDGTIAATMMDLMLMSGCFNREEIDEYVRIGALDSFFVLGRSIGFIGHFLDQKRLKQSLYRHPWEDITYLPPDS